jgi:hypothetical protein
MYSIRCVLIFLAVAVLSLAGYSQDADKKAEAESYLTMADEMRAGSTAANDIREILVWQQQLIQPTFGQTLMRATII